MTEEAVTHAADGVLTVSFERPEQHNALTFAMYDAVGEACELAEADDGVRALVLRGAGGRAFAAGTDISQFRDFADGSDGIAYEARISRVVNRLEEVAVPTVAVVDGLCVGGGLVLASACDLRVATHGSRFGVPIARTLGNGLSMNSLSLLVDHLGRGTALDLLLRGRMLDAEQAAARGFLAELCDADDLEQVLADVLETLLAHAPLTMWAAKTGVARLRRANLPEDEDLVAATFGSEDFRRAVAAFGSRTTTQWTGR